MPQFQESWKVYDGLVDFGAKAHYRVKRSKNEFANGRNNIKGIENVFASCYSSFNCKQKGFCEVSFSQISWN